MSTNRTLFAKLDHLLWAVPYRATGIAELERLTGVRAAIGGQHIGEGTHNALARLDDEVYFEIIAPDPELPPGTFSRKVAHVTEPSLELWACRTPSADATVDAARAAGLSAEPIAMSRTTPAGVELHWKLIWVTGHNFSPLVPFFIDWLDTPHPAPTLPEGLSLASFVLKTRRTDELAEVLEQLGVDQAVEYGSHDQLVAEIDSPQGRVRLTGPG